MLIHLSDSSDCELNVIKATLGDLHHPNTRSVHKTLSPSEWPPFNLNRFVQHMNTQKFCSREEKAAVNRISSVLLSREHSGKNGEENCEDNFYRLLPEWSVIQSLFN